MDIFDSSNKLKHKQVQATVGNHTIDSQIGNVYKDVINAVRKELADQILEQTNGNYNETANILGISTLKLKYILKGPVA